jgi:acetyltransferase EpsM
LIPFARRPVSKSGPMNPQRDLIVIGGGQHARVVVEAARTRLDLWNVVGFTDPVPCPDTSTRLGLTWLGTDEEYLACGVAARSCCILGFCTLDVSAHRADTVARYQQAGHSWATVVHERAWVSPSARLGQGVFVAAGAVVNTGAHIGDHCVVNSGAVVEHDVCLGDFVQVSPAAAIGGGTTIGRHGFLGLGCRVRDHVRIGANVLVGMGAVVTRSLADNDTVVGVPARSLLPAP